MPKLWSRLSMRKKARDKGEVTGDKEPPITAFSLLTLPDDLRSNPFSRATLVSSSHPAVSMEPDKQESPAFRLMHLPPELRLRTFTFCFGKRTLACRFNGQTFHYRIWPQGHPTLARTSCLALLRASRQLATEAKAALLDGTTFIITVEADENSYYALHPSIPRTIRALQTSSIRHAVFYFNAWGSTELEVCRQALLVFTNLKTVDLHFDFGCLDCFEDDDSHIFTHFLTADIARVRSISSVGYRYEKHNTATKKRYVAHTQMPAFKALLDKFKAIDVSAEQCGSVSACLLDGEMCEVDTSLVSDNDE